MHNRINTRPTRSRAHLQHTHWVCRWEESQLPQFPGSPWEESQLRPVQSAACSRCNSKLDKHMQKNNCKTRCPHTYDHTNVGTQSLNKHTGQTRSALLQSSVSVVIPLASFRSSRALTNAVGLKFQVFDSFPQALRIPCVFWLSNLSCLLYTLATNITNAHKQLAGNYVVLCLW